MSLGRIAAVGAEVGWEGMQPAAADAGAPYVMRARAALEAAAWSSPEPQRLASPINDSPLRGTLCSSPTATHLLSGHHSGQLQLPLAWSTPPSGAGLLTPQPAMLGLFSSPQQGCLASPWQAFGLEQLVHGQDPALPDLQPARTRCHLTAAGNLHDLPLEKLQPQHQDGEEMKQHMVSQSGFQQLRPLATPSSNTDQASLASGSGGGMAVRVQDVPWVKQEPEEVQQPLNGHDSALAPHHPQQQTLQLVAGGAPSMQIPAVPGALPGPAVFGAGPMFMPALMPGLTWMRGYAATPVMGPQAVVCSRPPLIVTGAQPGSAFTPMGYATPALPVRTRPAAATPQDSGPVGSMTQVACHSTAVTVSLPQDAGQSGGGSDTLGCTRAEKSRKRKAAVMQMQAAAVSGDTAATACAVVALADAGALPTAAPITGGTAAPAATTSAATVSQLGAAETASHVEHDVMARKREANRVAQQRFRERRKNTISALEQQVAELRGELQAAHDRCTPLELQVTALQQALAERDEELASLQAALKAANSTISTHTANFAT